MRTRRREALHGFISGQVRNQAFEFNVHGRIVGVIRIERAARHVFVSV